MNTVDMAHVQYTLTVLLNLFLFSNNVLGEAVAFFPPEARAMNHFQFMYPEFQPVSRNAMPQEYVIPPQLITTQEQMELQDHLLPIFHTSAAYPLVPPPVPETPMNGLNFSNDIVPRMPEEEYFRGAKSGYEYQHGQPQASYPSVPSYNYAPAPSYPPSAPAASTPAYAPPTPDHHSASKFPIFKSDLTSLIKPVTTKVATKVSGLIGLVLSLLTGTAPDDLEMKGFKEIVINGIVKPLLVAKGGIKSLISKLTIPVISLLLINLEVLITVWWLWEECPEPLKPTYAKPTYTPNYNSYR